MLAVVVALALSISAAIPALAATPSLEVATTSTQLTTQTVAGGWTTNGKTGAYVTKAQKKLFAKATSKMVGTTYTPVFVMAKQVVAGTNYAYFCKAQTVTAKKSTSWKVVIVNKPVKGKASVLAVNNFNYKKIKTLKNPPKASKADGAWKNISKKYKSKVLPKAARKAFNKAAKKYVGVELTPLVLLSSQVVAGTNYRYLCSGVVPGSKTVNYYAVDVYRNLKGSAKITSCKPVKMSAYLTVESGVGSSYVEFRRY